GTVLLDLNLDRLDRNFTGLADRGKVDEAWRDHGGRDHEDHQQHEHDVDVGHDVDLVLQAAARTAGCATYGRHQRTWRCKMFRNSSMKLSKRMDSRSISFVYRLYATTAGMAANRPMAVAMSASAIPGATAASVACCMLDRPMKACMIPQTVPNR